MKYGDLTFGQVEAMVNKLGGVGGVKRLLNDGFDLYPSVWKTISVGTGLKTPDDFRQALESNNCQVLSGGGNCDVLDILPVCAHDTEQEIDLVLVTTEELGLGIGYTYGDVYRRACELGLERCPSEVGPQLRLQYPDQRVNDRILVGMQPIEQPDGTQRVFQLIRSWGFCISSMDVRPDKKAPPEPQPSTSKYGQWVFVRPRTAN